MSPTSFSWGEMILQNIKIMPQMFSLLVFLFWILLTIQVLMRFTKKAPDLWLAKDVFGNLIYAAFWLFWAFLFIRFAGKIILIDTFIDPILIWCIILANAFSAFMILMDLRFEGYYWDRI